VSDAFVGGVRLVRPRCRCSIGKPESGSPRIGIMWHRRQRAAAPRHHLGAKKTVEFANVANQKG
jgi:hypothetical protein